MHENTCMCCPNCMGVCNNPFPDRWRVDRKKICTCSVTQGKINILLKNLEYLSNCIIEGCNFIRNNKDFRSDSPIYKTSMRNLYFSWKCTFSIFEQICTTLIWSIVKITFIRIISLYLNTFSSKNKMAICHTTIFQFILETPCVYLHIFIINYYEPLRVSPRIINIW